MSKTIDWEQRGHAKKSLLFPQNVLDFENDAIE